MPFVPANNVLQCEVRQTLDGQQIENVLYVSSGSGWDDAKVDAIHGSIVDLYTAIYAVLSTAIQFREAYYTDLTTATSPTYTRTGSLPINGADDAGSLPGNCALCVSHRTNGRGRSARGRTYIAGIPEDLVTGASISSGITNAVTTAFGLWRADIASGGYAHVIVSRFTGGDERVTALVQPVTVSLVVDNTVDSQRRRLPGRGR